jgi:tRNA pseudouridine38-40 synthase
MKYKIVFSYDGSNYYGFAKQVNEVTIQGELERCFSLILNQKIIIKSSGRTDRGVHALAQVADFTCNETLDTQKVLYQINKVLNKDIYVKSLVKVPSNFSSRLNCKKKVYEYRINIKEYNPLKRNYECYMNRLTNIDEMIEASQLFIGKHNFENFTSKETDTFDFVREIFDIQIKRTSSKIVVRFIGDGFMRYEIRKIMGALFEIGKGNLTKDYIVENLDPKTRHISIFQAPGHGLYLIKVIY